MAERIPIVLSLSDATADISDLSDEAVLRAVFGERGWDASVIAPLDQIQIGSTDELCLSGYIGSFVLLARKSFAAAIEQLERLNVFGTVRNVAEQSEPTPLGNASRAIYFFQLSNRAQFEKSLQKIREIQSSINTKVFALQMPMAARSQGNREQIKSTSSHTTNIVDVASSSNHSSVVPKRSSNDADLDRLLDELDESNI